MKKVYEEPKILIRKYLAPPVATGDDVTTSVPDTGDLWDDDEYDIFP